MKPLQDISDAKAQQLMSLLRDGELSPEGAELLNNYLESNPDAIDWMESLEVAHTPAKSDPSPIHRSESVSKIQEAIATTDEAKAPAGALLRFPALFRPVAAAAAVVIIGTVTWLGLRPSTTVDFQPSVVEFVASDLPDTSTVVYSDAESGWTVVWVDSESAPSDSPG